MKILAAALSLMLPLAAQANISGSTGSSSTGSSGASASAGSAHSEGAPSRPAPPAPSNPNAPHSNNGKSASQGSPGYYYGGYYPALSFYSYDSYLFWSGFYSYLSNYYGLNPLYCTRFYNNVEPLITPQILKLTLRDPVRMSSQMLEMIDQLESMYSDASSGKPINKALYVATSQQIRDMARSIRGERILSVYDLRKEKDLYSPESGPIKPEDFQKLRELALDLDRQLKNLYTASSTATISADSYKEPSMGSLAKGIEKICKAVEDSAKRK